MESETITKAVTAITELGRLIKDVKRIPSGHLYAQLMSVLSLPAYQYMLDILVKGDMIKIENHEVIWIGE